MPVANGITDLTKEGGIRSGPGKTAMASTNTMLAWEALRAGPTHGQRARMSKIKETKNKSGVTPDEGLPGTRVEWGTYRY